METPGKTLRGPRVNLLEALVILDGRAPTPAIEGAATGRTGTAKYYLDKMADQGLVAQDGRDWSTKGYPANIYRVTEAGEQALAAESERGDSLVTTAKLEDEIDDLKATVEDLQDTVDDIAPEDEGW